MIRKGIEGGERVAPARNLAGAAPVIKSDRSAHECPQPLNQTPRDEASFQEYQDEQFERIVRRASNAGFKRKRDPPPPNRSRSKSRPRIYKDSISLVTLMHDYILHKSGKGVYE
jgi:hypothetical protein